MLDVVVTAYKIDDQVVASKDQRYTIEVPADRVEHYAATGFNYQLDIAIPKPGPYQLWGAVRDPASGLAGSARRFVRKRNFPPGIAALARRSPSRKPPDWKVRAAIG